MKFCHLCTDACQKARKAGINDPSDTQQRTCLAIHSITDLLMIQGLICLDIVDVSSVMRDGGRAVVGVGEAVGEGRATRAAEAAILDLKQQLAALRTIPETSPDTLVDQTGPVIGHYDFTESSTCSGDSNDLYLLPSFRLSLMIAGKR